MNNQQIKHMVNRFLSWRLPSNFNPDCGISAKRPNYHPSVPWEPTGTNLFDGEQATAMVRHMLDGLPVDEFAWLIERGDLSPARPTYWAGPDHWSQDHMDAVRFARKEDAERVACRLHAGYHRVCEHGWS